jgi:hypothetical protein
MAVGDHIYVMRTSLRLVPFQHHGIDCGDGSVIHWDGDLGEKCNASIRRVAMAEFARGSPITVVAYDSAAAGVFSGAEAVRRAESRLGESGYNLVFNNCEHFARWCRTGDHHSDQVIAAATPPVGSAATALATASGLATVGALATAGTAGGAATMSGLAAVGAVLGGGAVAGIGALGVLPAVTGIAATHVLLGDDPKLPDGERKDREAARVASYVGAASGVAGGLAAVSASGAVAGLSAAGITSGLAAVGSVVGGGMVAGLAVTAAAPAVAALGAGYGVYRLIKLFR